MNIPQFTKTHSGLEEMSTYLDHMWAKVSPVFPFIALDTGLKSSKAIELSVAKEFDYLKSQWTDNKEENGLKTAKFLSTLPSVSAQNIQSGLMQTWQRVCQAKQMIRLLQEHLSSSDTSATPMDFITKELVFLQASKATVRLATEIESLVVAPNSGTPFSTSQRVGPK